MRKMLRRCTLAALAVLLLLTSGCMIPFFPSVSLSEPPATSAATPLPTASQAPAGDPDCYYTIGKDGHMGIINGLGQVVLPLQYGGAYVMEYNEAPAFIIAIKTRPIVGAVFNDEALLFNLDGTRLSEKTYLVAEPLSGSLIEYVSLDYKQGVMSYSGAEIIPCRYDDIMMCGESVIAVTSKENGTSAIDVYDPQGKLQCSGKLNLFDVTGDLLMTTDESASKYGLTDARLEKIVPAECSEISYAGAGLYVICRDLKYGVIDSNGKEIIPLAFDAIQPYDGGSGGETLLFSASSPEGAYVFDSSGKKQLFLEEYMFVEIYGDILIAKDKLYFEHYLVDGKDAIPSAGCLTWNDEAQILISSAYEACACYTKGGEKLPLPIMKNIEVISPERFIYCQWGSYLYGICASDGTIIAPADYLSLFQCIDTNFCIFIKSEAGKQTQGVIDVASGRILLEGYDSIWYEGGGLFGVISGKTSGLVDTNGGWLWRSDESTTELADLIQL